MLEKQRSFKIHADKAHGGLVEGSFPWRTRYRFPGPRYNFSVVSILATSLHSFSFIQSLFFPFFFAKEGGSPFIRRQNHVDCNFCGIIINKFIKMTGWGYVPWKSIFRNSKTVIHGFKLKKNKKKKKKKRKWRWSCTNQSLNRPRPFERLSLVATMSKDIGERKTARI